ncbi:integral membrane protein [Fusarium oxysporum f. sp. phaseoli]
MSFPRAAPPPSGVEPNLKHPQDVLSSCNYARQALTIAFMSAFVVTRFMSRQELWEEGQQEMTSGHLYFLRMAPQLPMSCICEGHLVLGVDDRLGLAVVGSINWKYERNMRRFLSIRICCHYLLRSYGPDRQTCSPLYLIRAFEDVHKESMTGIYIFIGMLVAYYVSGLFIKIFICWPISA